MYSNKICPGENNFPNRFDNLATIPNHDQESTADKVRKVLFERGLLHKSYVWSEMTKDSSTITKKAIRQALSAIDKAEKNDNLISNEDVLTALNPNTHILDRQFITSAIEQRAQHIVDKLLLDFIHGESPECLRIREALERDETFSQLEFNEESIIPDEITYLRLHLLMLSIRPHWCNDHFEKYDEILKIAIQKNYFVIVAREKDQLRELVEFNALDYAIENGRLMIAHYLESIGCKKSDSRKRERPVIGSNFEEKTWQLEEMEEIAL